MTKIFIAITLVAFLLVGAIGVGYASVAMGHDMGCPFAFGITTLCAQSLAHISHWQSAFAATLVEIVAFSGFALIAVFLFKKIPVYIHFERYRFRSSVPDRPTELQRLFARGILHRRAP